MRLMPRRKFLALAAAATTASAISPLDHALAVPQAEPSYKDIANGIFNWYCKNYYDFRANLDQKENAFIDSCISLIDAPGYAIGNNFAYSLFSFSHRVTNTKVNSSRTAFGSFEHREKLQPAMNAIIASYGVDPMSLPNSDKLFALGWDAEEKHLKIYMFLDSLDVVKDKSLLELKKSIGNEAIHPMGLSSVTVKDKAIFEKKIYLAPRNPRPKRVAQYPFSDSIVHTNYMITDKRGIVPQVDIGFNFAANGLNDTGKAILAKHRSESRLDVDTIAYQSEDSFTLYFP